MKIIFPKWQNYSIIDLINSILFMLNKSLLLSSFLLILFVFISGCAHKIILNPYTYINNISTPKLTNSETLRVINYFNSLGDYKIIRRKGSRPINIYEKEFKRDPKRDDYLLGQALDLDYKCIIWIDPSRITSSKQYAQVLIHEILHCFGYRHTKRVDDLMAPYYNEDVSEENIKSYAKELEGFFDE